MLVVSIGLGIFLRYSTCSSSAGTRASTPNIRAGGDRARPDRGDPKALVGAGIAILFLVLTVAWLKMTRMGKASRPSPTTPRSPRRPVSM